MEPVEDLIQAISEFKPGSPEARECCLKVILNHSATELICPALFFIIPHLNESEREIVQTSPVEGVLAPGFMPTEKFVSTLLISALRSQYPETREQAAAIIREHEERVGWKVKKEILLLLADSDEGTRETCAKLLSEFKGKDASLFEHFVDAFYVGNFMREGRQLVREISTEEEAIPFIYLCISKYDFSAQEKANDSPNLILSSLYNHARDRWDFYQAEYKARQIFLKDQLKKGVRGQEFEKLKTYLQALQLNVITKAERDLQRISSIPPKPPTAFSPPKTSIAKL